MSNGRTRIVKHALLYQWVREQLEMAGAAGVTGKVLEAYCPYPGFVRTALDSYRHRGLCYRSPRMRTPDDVSRYVYVWIKSKPESGQDTQKEPTVKLTGVNQHGETVEETVTIPVRPVITCNGVEVFINPETKEIRLSMDGIVVRIGREK